MNEDKIIILVKILKTSIAISIMFLFILWVYLIITILI